jgi:hypothetical protein
MIQDNNGNVYLFNIIVPECSKWIRGLGGLQSNFQVEGYE